MVCQDSASLAAFATGISDMDRYFHLLWHVYYYLLVSLASFAAVYKNSI